MTDDFDVTDDDVTSAPKVGRSNALITIGSALPSEFIDYAKNPRPEDPPLATFHSTIVALNKLGLKGSYNIFRNELLLGSEILNLNDGGELSDHACLALRRIVREIFVSNHRRRTCKTRRPTIACRTRSIRSRIISAA